MAAGSSFGATTKIAGITDLLTAPCTKLLCAIHFCSDGEAFYSPLSLLWLTRLIHDLFQTPRLNGQSFCCCNQKYVSEICFSMKCEFIQTLSFVISLSALFGCYSSTSGIHTLFSAKAHYRISAAIIFSTRQG